MLWGPKAWLSHPMSIEIIDNHIVKATRFRGKFTDLVVKTHEIEVFHD